MAFSTLSMRFLMVIFMGMVSKLFGGVQALPQPGNPFQVPVPWAVSNIQLYNTRHGSGATWSLSILDTPTNPPQGFNTTCTYYVGSAYEFAYESAPTKEPCADKNVTFGFFPNAGGFELNITHVYGNCGTSTHPKACVDYGKWHFSKDDVIGQEQDVQNNFGQAGSFFRSGLSMYPKRAIPSSKCEFC